MTRTLNFRSRQYPGIMEGNWNVPNSLPTENSKTCIARHDHVCNARSTSNNEQKMKYWALRVYMNLLFAKQNSNNRSPVRVIHVQYPTVLDRTFHRMKQTFRNKPSIYISRFRFVRYLSFLSFFFFFHLINKIQKFQKIHAKNNEYESHYALFLFFFLLKLHVIRILSKWRIHAGIRHAVLQRTRRQRKRTNEQFVSSMENRSTPPCRGSATAWSAVTSQRLTLYARLKWNNEEARFIHRTILPPLTCNR